MQLFYGLAAFKVLQVDKLLSTMSTDDLIIRI